MARTGCHTKTHAFVHAAPKEPGVLDFGRTAHACAARVVLNRTTGRPRSENILVRAAAVTGLPATLVMRALYLQRSCPRPLMSVLWRGSSLKPRKAALHWDVVRDKAVF